MAYPHKTLSISGQRAQNISSISDQNMLYQVEAWVTHTCVAYIGKQPLPPLGTHSN